MFNKKYIKVLILFFIFFCFSTGAVFSQSEELKSTFTKTKAAYKEGDLEKALFFAKNAIKISKLEFGTNHRITATLLSNIGEIHMDLKSYNEAEQYFKEATLILKKVLEENDPAIADSLSLIALSLTKQLQFKEAMDLHRESLLIMSRTISTNPHAINEITRKASLYRARAMYTKASLEMENKNYESAIGYLKTSTRLFTSSLGRDKTELKETSLLMLDAANKANDKKTINIAKGIIKSLM